MRRLLYHLVRTGANVYNRLDVKYAALALTLCLTTPAGAVRPLTPKAPEFSPNALWINSKAITLKSLSDKRALLLAFFNATNINSLRALGTLKEWHRRYSSDGLVTVGVHTPDYDFQKDQRAVHAAVKRLGISFPVIIDGDRKVWKDYANDGWPAFYLIDHKGRIIFDQLGEGGYTEFESEIRNALDNIPGFNAPKVPALIADPPTAECGPVTRDISAGTKNGAPIALKETEIRLNYLFATRDGELGYFGPWTSGAEALRLPGGNPNKAYFITVIYRGVQGFAVMGSSTGKPIRIQIKQDDLWLHPSNAGKDILFDDDGHSYVEAAEYRLYDLTRNANDLVHEIMLTPLDPGAAVYTFSFSDRCMAGYLP